MKGAANMPWHEPRLTGASGEPTVREGQGKLTRAENFYQRGATGSRRPMKPRSRFMSWRGSFGSGTAEGPHRSPMPEKQPQEYPVTVEVGGKRYTGFYTVSSGSVRVESDWGERSTETVGRAEQTARLLLLELLRRAKVLR